MSEDMTTAHAAANAKPWMHASLQEECALLPLEEEEAVLKGATKVDAGEIDSDLTTEQTPENMSRTCTSLFQPSPADSELSADFVDASEEGLENPTATPGSALRLNKDVAPFSHDSPAADETAAASPAARQLSPEPKPSPPSPPSPRPCPRQPEPTAPFSPSSCVASQGGGAAATAAPSSSAAPVPPASPVGLSSDVSAAVDLQRVSPGGTVPGDNPARDNEAEGSAAGSADDAKLREDSGERAFSPAHPQDGEGRASMQGDREPVAGSTRGEGEKKREGDESQTEEASTRAQSLSKKSAESRESSKSRRRPEADAAASGAALAAACEGLHTEEGREETARPPEDAEASVTGPKGAAGETERAAEGPRDEADATAAPQSEKRASSSPSAAGAAERATPEEARTQAKGRLDAKMRAKFKREFVRSWVDINRAPSWPPIKKNKYLSSDWKRVDLRKAAGEIRVETKKHRLFLNDLCYLFDGVFTQKSTLGRKAGLGLFCERPEGLHKGQIITEFVGWLVDRDLAESYRKQRTASHIVAVQKGFLYIDGAKEPAYGMGGGSFANDGSEFLGGPGNNAQFYHWFDEELGRTRVFLRATADIKNGQEIFVPYHKTYWVDNFEEQAENCPDAFKQRKLEQLRRRYKNPEFVHIPHREELRLRQQEEAERKKRVKEEAERKKRQKKEAEKRRCPVKRPCSAYLLFSISRRRELMKARGLCSGEAEESDAARPQAFAAEQKNQRTDFQAGRGADAPAVGGERKRRQSAGPTSRASAGDASAAPSEPPAPSSGAKSARKRRRTGEAEDDAKSSGGAASAEGSSRPRAASSSVPSSAGGVSSRAGDDRARATGAAATKGGSRSLMSLSAALTREIAREWGTMKPEQKKRWEQTAEKERARYLKAVQRWKEKTKKRAVKTGTRERPASRQQRDRPARKGRQGASARSAGPQKAHGSECEGLSDAKEATARSAAAEA
ncbi:SET domain containing lysine methyltransferase KMTox [Besnoitia besnoiti]|uniref:SET domain containing lysine methyltransferase KMTox n=1 Tax=Besnoitia besnoiti TaxID=94643 RepID=A0A2A9M5T2_BESBE|nr:SET domain containing lysine methyltransferase KMTox [Besnoitia besnoiti]PFH31246.1 SET domain containing lysine methyltransferase KMTox [Besnoitia besnoiti]